MLFVQNCKPSTEMPNAAAQPDDDNDDDDEPAEDMDAYVESGKLEDEDNVMIFVMFIY